MCLHFHHPDKCVKLNLSDGGARDRHLEALKTPHRHSSFFKQIQHLQEPPSSHKKYSKGHILVCCTFVLDNIQGQHYWKPLMRRSIVPYIGGFECTTTNSLHRLKTQMHTIFQKYFFIFIFQERKV